MDMSSTANLAFPKDPNGGSQTFGDYDNDGFLDVLMLPFQSVNGAGYFYHNQGDGTFQAVDIGSPLVDGACHQSVAWADYDNDGFLDLFVACNAHGAGEVSHLYRNNAPKVGNRNHWLKVKLEGRVSNRAAIGAKVRALASITGTPRSQIREISGNYDYLSSEAPSLIAHFGLGDATKVETLRIEWPSGIVQELKDVAVDQQFTVVEHEDYAPTNPAPAIASVGTSTNGLQLAIQEPAAGARYALEGSSDLTRWAMLLSRTSAGETKAYTDTKATNSAVRFYRVIVP